MSIEKVSENIWVLSQRGALVSFQSKATPNINPDTGKLMSVNITDAQGATKPVKIMAWGSRNMLPQEREDLIKANNIIPELLGTKRDITLGGGIFCYKERIVEEGQNMKVVRDPVEMPPEVKQFLDKVEIEKYMRKACKNLIIHANTFTEFTCLASGKVDMISAHESRHARAAEQNEMGKIPSYFLCGKWDKPSKEYPVSEVAAFDNTAEFQPKFMYHAGDDLLTDDYYYIPRWWGGKDWIVLSNRVPVFHNKNLDNGYVIRWHIEVPKDYFRDYTSQAQSPEDIESTKKKESDARRKFLSKLNQFLAAEEGAGRAVITDYEINKQIGKDFPGIKITALKVDIQDKALLDLFEKSNDANISGQGVPPALANIQTPGRLGTGSETRNSFLLYLATKTPVPRSILLEPLYLVAKKNGWDPDIKFGFRDIEITTLDDNKSGAQPAQVA